MIRFLNSENIPIPAFASLIRVILCAHQRGNDCRRHLGQTVMEDADEAALPLVSRHRSPRDLRRPTPRFPLRRRPVNPEIPPLGDSATSQLQLILLFPPAPPGQSAGQCARPAGLDELRRGRPQPRDQVFGREEPRHFPHGLPREVSALNEYRCFMSDS